MYLFYPPPPLPYTTNVPIFTNTPPLNSQCTFTPLPKTTNLPFFTPLTKTANVPFLPSPFPKLLIYLFYPLPFPNPLM